MDAADSTSRDRRTMADRIPPTKAMWRIVRTDPPSPGTPSREARVGEGILTKDKDNRTMATTITKTYTIRGVEKEEEEEKSSQVGRRPAMATEPRRASTIPTLTSTPGTVASGRRPF